MNFFQSLSSLTSSSSSHSSSQYITEKNSRSLHFEIMSTVKASCSVAPNGKPCDASDESANKTVGTISFVQVGTEPTTITYKVSGLEPGHHAFHIHEFADFSNGCMSAGPHYNPFGKNHGGPTDEDRHVGDLGNILADVTGLAEGSIVADLIHL